MPKVADVMTKRVVTLRNDATLAEALTYLATQHITGAAVTDYRQRLVGVISRSDIMEAEAEITEPKVRGWFLNETLVNDVMTSPGAHHRPRSGAARGRAGHGVLWRRPQALRGGGRRAGRGGFAQRREPGAGDGDDIRA
jgi:hypothetical protein